MNRANGSLIISAELWRTLVLDLRLRGDSRRESGAFLLAQPQRNEVAAYVCYDDLDPQSLDEGIIVFKGSGYVPLWDLCTERQLRVIADVHTHPDGWVGQSHADSTHPMIGTPGHIALIIPYFARYNEDTLRGIGVYRYLGNHQWHNHSKQNLFEISS